MNLERLKRTVNPYFFAVLLFITINYLIFVFQYAIARNPQSKFIIIAIFHILFIMLLWSMFTVILSDPGKVPIYWGFFAEQSDNKKRRYCLLCHSFKPQRCHHCSTCQRCVLNMDHHCPWISNCVGFSNRKFFMLFLLYIILTLVFSIVCQFSMLLAQGMKISANEQSITIHSVIRLIALIAQIAFFFPITIFFKFHVELVLSNSSTLDNLQKQRNPNIGPNIYDIGAYENFHQVFGPSVYLWLLPLADKTQKANGVSWPKNQ